MNLIIYNAAESLNRKSENALFEVLNNKLRKYSVDTSKIIWKKQHNEKNLFWLSFEHQVILPIFL